MNINKRHTTKAAAIVCVIAIIALFFSSCAKLKSIKINGVDSIPVGGDEKFWVTFDPESQKEPIEWSSSDETIATVSELGRVYGESEGEVTITAKAKGNIEDSYTVTIYAPVKVNIDKERLDLVVGDSSQLKLSTDPSDAKYDSIEWESGNESIAVVDDDGTVTAKDEGETIIFATFNKDNIHIKKSCDVYVKAKPIEYSGSGDKVITGIAVPGGMYKATFTNNGSSNFAVKYYNDKNSDSWDLLVNEIGSYTGSCVLRSGSTNATDDAMIEIKSNGAWTVKLEKIDGEATSPLKGQGDFVSGTFVGDGERNVAKISNNGQHNFVVRIYDSYGDWDLLVNEIGSYNGEVTFDTVSGRTYYWEVTSSGTWSIEW